MINIHSAQTFSPDLQDYIYRHQDVPMTLFVAGGSQIAQLQDALTTLNSHNVKLPKLQITLTDERFGPLGHQDSNYAKIQQATGELLSAMQIKLIPVLTEGKDLKATATQYAEFVKTSVSETQTLMLLGMGQDGHIAGILPHKFGATAVFYDQIVVGYETHKFGLQESEFLARVTLSFYGLEMISDVWLYATGEAKAQLIDQLNKVVVEGREVKAGEVAEKPFLFLSQIDNLEIYS